MRTVELLTDHSRVDAQRFSGLDFSQRCRDDVAMV